MQARHLRLEGRLLELAEPLEPVQAGQRGQVHRARHLVDVAFLELERRGREELGEEALVGALRDLEPDRGAPFPLPQGLLDRREEAALDLVFLDRQVAVARGAEGHPLDDPVAAKESVEPRADHIFEQHEPALGIALVRQWNQPVNHRGHLEHGVQQAVVLVERLDPQEQVQALVVDVREGMRRVDGQRRQDRVDLAVEVLVEEGILGALSSPGGQIRMPCSRSCGWICWSQAS